MKTKFYWHMHHDVLVEPLIEPIENRIRFIKENKPKCEIALRLKLLKPVKGKLPVEVVKALEAYDKAREAYVKAWEAYDKAREAFVKAVEAYVKALEACGKAREACGKAGEAYNKAREAYDKAWEAYDKALIKNKKAIEKLHAKECPDCPWNGKSIFSKEE